MGISVDTPRTWRFGVFELDAYSGELRRNGSVVKLREQPARILVLLLEHAGQMVTREQLRQHLWPSDTFVDFDHSLNAAVMKLREALGDSADKPLYIETIPRKGYRFVAPVSHPTYTQNGGASSQSTAGSELAASNTREPSDGVIEAPSNSPDEKRDRRRMLEPDRGWNSRQTSLKIAAGVLAILAVALAAAVGYRWHRPLPPPRITAYTQITYDGHRKILAGTDGSRLYFTQTLSQFFLGSNVSDGEIAQMAVTGGKIAQIPVSVPNPLLLDVSSDGSSLLVLQVTTGDQAQPVFIVRTLGGFTRRLGDAQDASFSTDGKTVIYSTPQGEIWLSRSDGSEAHKLASVGGDALDIALAPDASGIIRFTRGNTIWQMSPGESAPHKLLPSLPASSRQCCGRWSRDGKFFLFLSEAEGFEAEFESEIWALDERRGLLRRPPTEPVKLAGAPFSWGRPILSNDGKSIFAEGQAKRGELSRFDAQTKQFVPFLGGISAQGIDFSRDGKSIAYVSYPEDILWKANRDGSDPIQLSEPSMWAFLPRWSPDSKQIAFTGVNRKGAGSRNYVVSPEGDSPPAPLLNDNQNQETPSWSPDGHKIAFDYLSTDNNGGMPIDTRILDLASRQVTKIPGSDGLGMPRWSHDGRYLCVTHNYLHLKIFDFKTQQWSELTPKGTMDSPEWSRDDRYIYFRRITGDKGIFRMSVKSGTEEKIADLKDWHDAGWFGAYMGLDPTDAPLLLRDVGHDDIYALTLQR